MHVNSIENLLESMYSTAINTSVDSSVTQHVPASSSDHITYGLPGPSTLAQASTPTLLVSTTIPLCPPQLQTLIIVCCLLCLLLRDTEFIAVCVG